jgi:hypothetical protein
MVVEQWTPLTAVGTYRRIERRGTPKIFQVGSEATAAAVTEVLPLSDERLPINAGIGPHADILASESVEQLRAELLRGHADPREPVTYRLIRAVRVLHSHHVVPARLAGGLWRMLAQQPDLTFAGEVTDRAGRSGQAIAFDFDLSLPKRWMLVISPETGRLLAFEEILTTDAGKLNIQIPAVIGYEVFLTQEWAVAER